MGEHQDEEDAPVDKKIEATLPRAEQSTVARSRKSSYMLRIFDKAEPSDVSNKEDKSDAPAGRGRRGTLESVMPIRKPSRVAEDPEEDIAADMNPRQDLISKVQALSTEAADWAQSERGRQSDPVKTKGKEKTPVDEEPPEEEELERSPTSPEDTLSRQTTYTAGDEDRELVQKEHVTSAVYYPHRTPDQQAAERLRSPSKGRGRPTSSRDNNHHARDTPSQAELDDRRIELSLQSGDDNQYLQGDFPTLTRVSSNESQDVPSQSEGSQSATESDWEMSEDERTDSERPPKSTGGIPVAHDAIELKPFSHQVGGHAAVYRVSRKAICKKVNNKENKFYETVERWHPDLLDFMPRCVVLYIY